VYPLNIFYHTKFQDPILSNATIFAISEVFTTSVLVLLMLGRWSMAWSLVPVGSYQVSRKALQNIDSYMILQACLWLYNTVGRLKINGIKCMSQVSMFLHEGPQCKQNNLCCFISSKAIVPILTILFMNEITVYTGTCLLLVVISLTAVLFICTICTVKMVITYKLWTDAKQLV
jgi:hypothetical protein